MPRGIPKSGKRHSTLKAAPPGSQTQRLIEALQEIEERLAVERAKDKARAALLAFVHKHGLSAADLRDAAKIVGARATGDEPVTSLHLGKAKRIALGRRLKEARVAKGLQGTQLGKLVGAKGTAAVVQWESGMIPTMPKYRAALIKHLGLPKDFFAEVPGRANAANGHAA
jgi:hypothetical protein